MKLSFKKIEVGTTKINTTWTNEMIQDLKCYGFTNLDIEKEMRKTVYAKRKKIIEKLLKENTTK